MGRKISPSTYSTYINIHHVQREISLLGYVYVHMHKCVCVPYGFLKFNFRLKELYISNNWQQTTATTIIFLFYFSYLKPMCTHEHTHTFEGWRCFIILLSYDLSRLFRLNRCQVGIYLIFFFAAIFRNNIAIYMHVKPWMLSQTRKK